MGPRRDQQQTEPARGSLAPSGGCVGLVAEAEPGVRLSGYVGSAPPSALVWRTPVGRPATPLVTAFWRAEHPDLYGQRLDRHRADVHAERRFGLCDRSAAGHRRWLAGETVPARQIGDCG